MKDALRSVPPARIAAWALMLLAMFFVIRLGLVAALLAGLLVFVLTHVLSPLIERRLHSNRARIITVALLAAVIVGALTLAIFGLWRFSAPIPVANRNCCCG